jgi:hypothetical protein
MITLHPQKLQRSRQKGRVDVDRERLVGPERGLVELRHGSAPSAEALGNSIAVGYDV